MKRVRIIQEGIEFPDGRLVEVGAIKFPDDHNYVPVDLGFDHMSFMGRATNMQREEDGWVTINLELYKDAPIAEDDIDGDMYEAAVYLAPIEVEGDWHDRPMKITNGLLRAVSVVAVQGIPRGVVKT